MKLIFVYNANSGKLNALFDAGHKLLNPSTYQCSLFTITYGTFTEKSVWKSFRNQSDIEMEFFHKDQFEDKFPNIKIYYPAVLKLYGNQLTTIITPDILNELENVEDLIERLKPIL